MDGCDIMMSSECLSCDFVKEALRVFLSLPPPPWCQPLLKLFAQSNTQTMLLLSIQLWQFHFTSSVNMLLSSLFIPKWCWSFFHGHGLGSEENREQSGCLCLISCMSFFFFIAMGPLVSLEKFELNCLCYSSANNNTQHVLTPNSSHMDAWSGTLKNDAQGVPSALKSDTKSWPSVHMWGDGFPERSYPVADRIA